MAKKYNTVPVMVIDREVERQELSRINNTPNVFMPTDDDRRASGMETELDRVDDALSEAAQLDEIDALAWAAALESEGK